MLLNLREYHRPSGAGEEGLDRALQLLSRPGIHTLPLAGGDTLVGSGNLAVEAVVDLQALVLDGLSYDLESQVLHLGAMATRTALSTWLAGLERAPSLAAFLRDAAAEWGGNVQRNRATLGGAVVTGAPNDPLVAALLATDAQVILRERGGYDDVSLHDLLLMKQAQSREPVLLTEIVVEARPGWRYGLAHVARTPSDAPIVLVAAALDVREGVCAAARIVLGGVAARCVRAAAAEAMLAGAALNGELLASAGLAATQAVAPVGDYRGSADYRREMVRVLTERALKRAIAGAGRRAGRD